MEVLALLDLGVHHVEPEAMVKNNEERGSDVDGEVRLGETVAVRVWGYKATQEEGECSG